MNLTKTPAWLALAQHYENIRTQKLSDWFAHTESATERAQQLSLEAAGIFFDFSKNRITGQTIQLLSTLAHDCHFEAKRDAMCQGALVNNSEQRAALHMALRVPLHNAKPFSDVFPKSVLEEAHATLKKMRIFCEQISDGTWKGAHGKRIRHIVHIGIGGSELGPRLVCKALQQEASKKISLHFLSNIDPLELEAIIECIDPFQTLVIVCSKTFSTAETMTNAQSLRSWFLECGVPKENLNQHFIAVTSFREKAESWGIDAKNVFEVFNWVGGRYSLWSAVGLPIALTLGYSNFERLLAGAHAMDEHFCTAPVSQNMPAILGLIGIWHRNFFDSQTYSVAPYSHALRDFPAYLQQLEMESNGKSVQLDGTNVDWHTSPIVWGQAGTNGQHAFFQLLHQGTSLVPVDFIAIKKSSTSRWQDHHQALLANCLSQSKALMLGSGTESAGQYCYFPGNRPSNTLLLNALTPENLGALLALYEHKVFVQSTIWHINPFDQWGVELGKKLSKEIKAELASTTRQTSETQDASTLQLIQKATFSTIS